MEIDSNYDECHNNSSIIIPKLRKVEIIGRNF